MADSPTIGKAYIQILPTMKGTTDTILDGLKKPSETAGDEAGATAGTSFMDKLKSTVKKIAVTAGIGKILTESLNAGADLEQNIGGIQTMFKENANELQKLAQNAYKTAGVSANTYMEQVTSFSASLISSLGGDTKKAVSYANRIMTDMSDNANKYGTNIESIQNAYQGFAKQNYTMLDNLKLGFGGTKEEMQRLIKEASAMTDIQEELGVTVDETSLSFDNITSAISVYQKYLGITGTTAEEAESTFSGSLNMMKSAWENFLSALMMDGKEGINIEDYISPLIESAETFLIDNLLPALGRVASAVLKAIPDFIVTITDAIVTSTDELLSQTSDTDFTSSATSFMTSLGEAIIYAIPKLITCASEILASLCDALVQAIDAMDAEEASGWANAFISKSVDGISSNGGTVVKAAGKVTSAFSGALVTANKEAFAGESASPLSALIMGWIDYKLIAKITAFASKIGGAFSNVGEAISGATAWIGESGIGTSISTFFSGAVDTVGGAVASLGSFAAPLALTVGSVVAALFVDSQTMNDGTPIGDWLGEVGQKCQEFSLSMDSLMKSTIFSGEWWTTMVNDLITLLTSFPSMISEMLWNQCSPEMQSFLQNISDGLNYFFSGQLINDLWTWISTGADNIKNNISTWWNNNIQPFISKVQTFVDSVVEKIRPFGDKVKTFLQDPVESIKNKIEGFVNDIKGFFSNFSFSIPHISLPHFSISPKNWSIGQLAKGKIPNISVSWYAKAMNEPYMLRDATLFGAGEAGDEVVYGHAQLMSDIRSAVAENSGSENNFNNNVTITVVQRESEDIHELAQRIKDEFTSINSRDLAAIG